MNFQSTRHTSRLLIILLFLSACASPEEKPGESATSAADSINSTATDTSSKLLVNPGSTVRTGLDLEPAFAETDSVQILYYDNPDGDSLRYTRYFKYNIATDSGYLNSLRRSLESPANLEAAIRPCRSEGKMYLFAKNDAVKTLYFSGRTESCNYLYFIKDGNFYYLPLSAEMKELLKRYRKKSRRP